MALSVAEFQARIGKELAILGELSSIQDYIIKDSLGDIIQRTHPNISAALVVSSATKTYSIPATIDTIFEIENELGNPVVYSLDRLEGEITFQDGCNDGATYLVYGTPKNFRTNIAAVIAGLDEKYEAALWQWIRYRAHRQAHHEFTEQEYAHALDETHILLQQINGDSTTQGRTIAIVDMQGKKTGVDSQVDGVTQDYVDSFKTDSYE
jgi:hypothetical protein